MQAGTDALAQVGEALHQQGTEAEAAHLPGMVGPGQDLVEVGAHALAGGLIPMPLIDQPGLAQAEVEQGQGGQQHSEHQAPVVAQQQERRPQQGEAVPGQLGEAVDDAQGPGGRLPLGPVEFVVELGVLVIGQVHVDGLGLHQPLHPVRHQMALDPITVANQGGAENVKEG